MYLKLGKLFIKGHQTSEAVKSLETALEQAKMIYPEKPHIILAEIQNELGMALFKGSSQNSGRALLYFQDAKKTMDQILETNKPLHGHSVTSLILYNIGTYYYRLGDFANAFQIFQDALNLNSESYHENSGIVDGIAWDHMGSLCSNFACTAERTGNFILAGEHFAKAAKIYSKMALTKPSCLSNVVVNLYRLSGICEILEQPDEALKHLERAREIAIDADFKHWIVVDLFVSLIKRYAEMGCLTKSITCYVEAGRMAKDLPKHNSLPSSVLDTLKLMKI